MPAVPYDPTSSIAPFGGGTPELRPSVNPDAFGVGIGEAIKGLGGSIAHVGDELFTRALAMQKLQNETIAKQADTDYMIHAGELHAKFNSLEGQAAVEAYPQYAKDLQASREAFRGRLPNDEARRMYDSQSLSTMGRSIFNGAGHSATEQKKWSAGVSASRVQAEKDGIFANPKDDIAIDRSERGIADEVRNQGDLHGWDSERTDQEIKRQLSETRAMRIAGLARTDPVKAQEMFEKYRPSMVAKDIERTDAIVQRQTYTTGARLIDATVNKDLYDPDRAEDAKERPLSERVAEARALAEKQFLNDPLAVEAATKAVEAGYERFKKIERQDSIQAKETVGTAMLGLNNQQGKLPTTMDELIADPKAAEAYDRLKASDKRSVQAALAKNAKGDVTETPERRDRYNQLKAMSVTFPAEFLDQEIWKEDIPVQMKQQLQDLKLKVMKGQADDPRVTAAMRQLEPSLRAAGITAQTKDDYLSFKGGLMGAMQAYRDVNQKPPNADEVQKMGARLLQERSTPWWGNPWSSTKTYAVPVPEDAAKIIKEDPAWGGTTPTEQQVQQTYMRTQFQKLYGKKEESSGPRITPPRNN